MHIVLILYIYIYLIYSYIIFLSYLPSGAWYHPLLVFLVAGSADASRVCLHEDPWGDHRSRSLFSGFPCRGERTGGHQELGTGGFFWRVKDGDFTQQKWGFHQAFFFLSKKDGLRTKGRVIWKHTEISYVSGIDYYKGAETAGNRAQLEADFPQKPQVMAILPRLGLANGSWRVETKRDTGSSCFFCMPWIFCRLWIQNESWRMAMDHADPFRDFTTRSVFCWVILAKRHNLHL